MTETQPMHVVRTALEHDGTQGAVYRCVYTVSLGAGVAA